LIISVKHKFGGAFGFDTAQKE